MSDALEPIRRITKLALFYLLAGGRVDRYMRLRAKVMHLLARSGFYERHAMRLLKRLVKEGDTVVDAGAHFGGYTVELARLVGPSGKVFAFEPLPIVFKLLCESTAQFPQVRCINAALSDQSQMNLTLHMPLLFGKIPEPALASLETPAMPSVPVSVIVNRLDDFQKELAAVKFIKSDVEGNEARLLLGARAVLARAMPILQCEANSTSEEQAIFQTLEAMQLGYQRCPELQHGRTAYFVTISRSL